MKHKRAKHNGRRRGVAMALMAWLTAVSLFACVGFLFLRVKGEQDRLLRASRQIQLEIQRYETDIVADEAEIERGSSKPKLEEMLIAKGSQLIPVPVARIGVLGEPETSSGRLAQNRPSPVGAGGQ